MLYYIVFRIWDRNSKKHDSFSGAIVALDQKVYVYHTPTPNEKMFAIGETNLIEARSSDYCCDTLEDAQRKYLKIVLNLLG